jgi:protein N-terminal methyltransferase
MPSPKRKSSDSHSDDEEIPTTKKPKMSNSPPDQEEDTASEIPITDPNAAPDSHIDHEAAINYWSSIAPTVNGVLGGYPEVSRADLQGSSNFFAKLRRQSKAFPPDKKLRRVVDCGAGIGRVTKGFLCKVAEEVDILEPVTSFTDQVKDFEGVGKIYNVGLEAWHPEEDVESRGTYDMIWIQWCIGQLTDVQLVDLLKRLPAVLSEGGWIVVKENLSNRHLGEDVFDETDSSVTRTDEKFRKLFTEAGLKLVSTELQKGFPKGLYPARAYALQPK